MSSSLIQTLTVGSGITPDQSPVIQRSRGLSPPVGNYALPRRILTTKVTRIRKCENKKRLKMFEFFLIVSIGKQIGNL